MKPKHSLIHNINPVPQVLTGNNGYVLPRNIDDMPVLIPEDVWYGDLDWKNSTINGGGLSFASVRIAAASGTDETSIFDLVNSADTTPGRPSKKHLILEAFEYGLHRGLFDFNESNATTYQKVREIIQGFFPNEYEDGKGLQDGAMQRHLAKLIDSERPS